MSTTYGMIWRVKTSPKIRHFLWKVIAGALAVAERLQSREIETNSLCKQCLCANESINHVLFTCSTAKQVWDVSSVPLPTAGFSNDSSLLNVNYLLRSLQDKRVSEENREVIPWLLWHIWKGRNSVIFQNTHVDTAHIISKAKEDALEWKEANKLQNLDTIEIPRQTAGGKHWEKPSPGWLKCNIGYSWNCTTSQNGASWLVRSDCGVATLYGQRAFSKVQSNVEAELLSCLWVVQSMRETKQRRVGFETSSESLYAMITENEGPSHTPSVLLDIRCHLQHIEQWSFLLTSKESNTIVERMANSVTEEHRFQSFIASRGPSWLQQEINHGAI